MDASNEKQIPQTFSHHVILYAKGWYGQSPQRADDHHPIIEDLQILLAEYSMAPLNMISERDIWQILISTFEEFVPMHSRKEALFDILGKKWAGWSDRFQRRPEEIMIGKISCVDGIYCDHMQRFDISLDGECHGVCEEHGWLNKRCGCECNCVVCREEWRSVEELFLHKEQKELATAE